MTILLYGYRAWAGARASARAGTAVTGRMSGRGRTSRGARAGTELEMWVGGWAGARVRATAIVWGYDLRQLNGTDREDERKETDLARWGGLGAGAWTGVGAGGWGWG